MTSETEIQVDDDLLLLEEMMSDLMRADPLYQTTNYWKIYEKTFLPELKRLGLRDFRRRRGSVLTSFGATDLLSNVVISVKPGSKFLGRLVKMFLEKFPPVIFRTTSIEPHWITGYLYRYVAKKFNEAGLLLDQCPTSAYGNPEDATEINGGYWSRAHLQKCAMLADFTKIVPLNQVETVLELGAGLGRNIEVMGHLLPNATLIVVDIPPQHYVANQYLSKVFGKRVIPYRDAIALRPEATQRFLMEMKGKIIILPSWRMPAWSDMKIDLFWNSASFQEMEPDVVTNYLGLIKKMSPAWIYINARPGGNYRGNWKPGKGGTRLPVTDDIYHNALQPEYDLDCQYDTDYFLRVNDYQSYIYKRRAVTA